MSQRIENPRDYDAEAKRRRWLIIAGAGVVVLAIVAYLVLRDDGEENRSAYCDELKTFVDGGATSVRAAASSAEKSQFDAIIDLAPSAVRPAWNGLADASLTKSPSAAQQQVFDAKLGAELDKIVADASANCSLDLEP